MSSPSVVLVLLGIYLALGVAMAMRFSLRGDVGAAVSAVFAWPLMLSDLSSGASPPGTGPYARDIRRGLGALREALREPEVENLVPESDLCAIEGALTSADGRVSRVDRLLQDPDVQASEDGQRLRAARARAAAEIEAVLKGLVQLRVQLGLVALAGETAPVREQLGSLVARLRALDELSGG